MVREFFESILNILKSRLFVLGILITVMFTTLLIRVFNLQIVNENYYLDNYIQKAEREVLTSGTRGLIYDSNGEVLAYNKLAYAVEIEDDLSASETKSDELNAIIAKTITERIIPIYWIHPKTILAFFTKVPFESKLAFGS